MPVAPGRSSNAVPRDRAKADRARAATPWRGWYGLKRWRDLRAMQLAEHPLCRMCEDIGVITQADVCDHVEPHRGDPVKFWSGPFQSLCTTHHDRDKQRAEAGDNFQYRPEWLRPSKIPLYIVCGPPCSGKSTYVAERAERDHLVIDLDVIAWRLAGSTGTLHGWDRERWLGPAMRQRNELLGALSKQPPWHTAWLVVSEPSADRRQWWADKLKPKDITVLETQPAVCMARARADAGRNRERTYEAITKWWAAYERRDGDVTIRGD